jgi:hypothetical protein
MSDRLDRPSRGPAGGVVLVPGQGGAARSVRTSGKLGENSERNKARVVAALTVTSTGLALYDLVRLTLGL